MGGVIVEEKEQLEALGFTIIVIHEVTGPYMPRQYPRRPGRGLVPLGGSPTCWMIVPR